MLHHHMDGTMRVRYEGRVLACTAFRTLPASLAAEDEKTIDARVDRLVAVVAQASVGAGAPATP